MYFDILINISSGHLLFVRTELEPGCGGTHLLFWEI